MSGLIGEQVQAGGRELVHIGEQHLRFPVLLDERLRGCLLVAGEDTSKLDVQAVLRQPMLAQLINHPHNEVGPRAARGK
eukprot:1383972-Heterocapsa_arctica.AAC.1